MGDETATYLESTADNWARVGVGLVLYHVDGGLAECFGQIFGVLDQQSLRLRRIVQKFCHVFILAFIH